VKRPWTSRGLGKTRIDAWLRHLQICSLLMPRCLE
jgi:hypothetical protein